MLSEGQVLSTGEGGRSSSATKVPGQEGIHGPKVPWKKNTANVEFLLSLKAQMNYGWCSL